MHTLEMHCDTPSKDTERDLTILLAMREARMNFNTRVIEIACTDDEKVLALLRSDATHQIAEFYYLIAAYRIRSTSDLDGMIERHNNYVAGLLANCTKARRMGLSHDRLLAAIFDGETRPRVLEIWDRNPGTLDQSSIGRFLVAVMSDETTRKALVALDAAGFLLRKNSVFRTVVVQSNGKLERVYSECLRAIRCAADTGPVAP